MPTITPGEITAGGASLWYGVTDPGDGNTVDLTAGVPASGTFLGGTDGPTRFRYVPTFQEIVSEQLTAAHDVFIELEEAELIVTAQQVNAANILRALNLGTQSLAEGTPAGTTHFFGGLTSVRKEMVVMSAPLRSDPTKFLHIGLYKAYVQGPFEQEVGRATPTTFTFTFRGLAEEGYTAGKQVGYYKFED